MSRPIRTAANYDRMGMSPAESEANEAMARAQRVYRVTDGTGRTVLTTRGEAGEAKALAKFNAIESPGAIYLRHAGGPERALDLRVDAAGDWVATGRRP